MLYILKNNEITVTISDLGAEIVSVKYARDCEYIWQGDPTYWTGQAPLLFPICGRLFEGKYTYDGKTFEMGNHGFARRSVFEAKQDNNSVTFTLKPNDDIKKMYPFDFELKVTYMLCSNTLSSSITINNTGDVILPAAIGLHPGFNVPLDNSGSFEDWYLEFENRCSPDELVFSDTCFMTGKKRALPLKDGKILPLRHELFSIDGVFMSNADRTVTLRSDKSNRYVKFSFPDMPYLGIWHKPRTEAPYVCIEPWCGLPAYDGVIDDFSTKCDMFRLIPGDKKTVNYSLIFG